MEFVNNLSNRENILELVEEFVCDVESNIRFHSIQIEHIPEILISIANSKGEMFLKFNHADSFHGSMYEWTGCLLTITHETNITRKGIKEFSINNIKLLDTRSGYYVTSLNLSLLESLPIKNIIHSIVPHSEVRLDKKYIKNTLKKWSNGKMKFILNKYECYLYIDDSPAYYTIDSSEKTKKLFLYLYDIIFYSGKFTDFFYSPFSCKQEKFIEINNMNFTLRCENIFDMKIFL